MSNAKGWSRRPKTSLLCASVSLYVCLVLKCCLDSKIIGGYPSIYMLMFRVETSGYDSRRTTPRVHEEDPNGLLRGCQNSLFDDSFDAPSTKRLPFKRGIGPKVMSLWSRRWITEIILCPVVAPSMVCVDGTCSLLQCLDQVKGEFWNSPTF